MGMLSTRDFYKPFEFPAAYDFMKRQQAMHWTSSEVSLHRDLVDFQSLAPAEQQNITHILRFFTQGDVDVTEGYVDKLMPHFKLPELRMLLTTIASVECIHVDAYSELIESLALPDVEYSKFHSYKEMADKHSYVGSFSPQVRSAITGKTSLDVRQLLKTVAVYSAFTEGLQLFSSFIILLNYTRASAGKAGKMNGLGEILEWSMRDESLHVEAMMWLFSQLKEEYSDLWDEDLQNDIVDIGLKMVELEDAFVDLAFSGGGVEGLTASEVKGYVRHICNRRINQLGIAFAPFQKDEAKPIAWVDEFLATKVHANFFEGTVTEYTKGALTGSWSWER